MQLGLALSGGGFRATMFHLGVVKALLDRGLLKDVRHITSVSGGSILAAHLVQNWREYNDPAKFEAAARRLIDFARKDVRGRMFRRLILPQYFLLPYLEHLFQWPPRLHRNGTVRNLLFERDLRSLYGDTLLEELCEQCPEAPRLEILTTNLNQGALAYFSNGFLVPNDNAPGNAKTPITVARAVMSSALFPGVFPTVKFDAENLMVDPDQFSSGQYFTDGGVFDNLGIRRFQTVLSQEGCEIDQVIVSDASGAFNWIVGTETLGQWKTALRSSEVFMKRLADLEKELAGGDQSDEFRFLRISDVTEPGVLPDAVQRQVKHIRTDLDRFSFSEIRALVLHGYEVAARATEGWTDVPPEKMVPWDPFPSLKKETEARWASQLRRSRFHPWGLFDRGDWPSYVYPVLLLIAIAFFVNWRRGERLHEYYGDQALMRGEIFDEVPEPEEAEALVERAVRRPHRNQDRRLEAAFLAYSLYLQKQDEKTEKLLAEAKKNLGPSQLERFHEAKWKHFHSKLQGTTFGFPIIQYAKVTLDYVEDAVNGVPARSPLHVETAVTSYGVYSTRENKAAQKRALDLLEKALLHLKKSDSGAFSDIQRYRAALVNGHYFLTKGDIAREKADHLGAEANYGKAITIYEDARDIRFADLWKVHFNVCNARNRRAWAIRDYMEAGKTSMEERTRNHLQSAIDENLRLAEENCVDARNVLSSCPREWQPTYALGVVEMKQGHLEAAANRFIEGHTIARRANEHASYENYLVDETNIKELCQFPNFSSLFLAACR